MRNALSHEEVAQIVKQSYPEAPARNVDRIAKLLIEDAHRSISPRTKQGAK